METAQQPKAYQLPKAYLVHSALLLLALSAIMALIDTFGPPRSEFAAEQVQVFLFAGLIEMAFRRPGDIFPVVDRKEIKPLLASLAILLACAISAMFALAALGVPKSLFHVLFPILFPCLTLFVGNRLLTMRGRTIVQTVMPAGARALVVVFVGVAFLASIVGLSALFSWLDAQIGESYLKTIALRTCGQFLLFFPFALYALTLREAFLFGTDEAPTGADA